MQKSIKQNRLMLIEVYLFRFIMKWDFEMKYFADTENKICIHKKKKILNFISFHCIALPQMYIQIIFMHFQRMSFGNLHNVS